VPWNNVIDSSLWFTGQGNNEHLLAGRQVRWQWTAVNLWWQRHVSWCVEKHLTLRPEVAVEKNRRRFCTTDFVSSPLFCLTPESGYSKIRQQACGCGQFAQKCREPFFSHFFQLDYLTGWSIFHDGQPKWVSVRCSLMGAYNSQRFLVFNSRCSDSAVARCTVQSPVRSKFCHIPALRQTAKRS